MTEVEVNSATASEIIPPVQEEPKQAKSNKDIQVMADESGLLIGRTMSEQIKVANMLLQGGTLSKAFDTVAKIMTGMQYALEIGLRPITGLRQMYYVHGTITIYGDAPMALVNAKGLVEDHEEFLVDKEYKIICFENKNLHVEPWAAVVRTKRKGRKKWIEKYFTYDQAVSAGLHMGHKGPKANWQHYRGTMLMARARTANIKANFSDALGGMAIAEYDFNEMPDARDVSEQTSNEEATNRINDMFKTKEKV